MKIKIDLISSYNMGLLRQLSKDLIGQELILESDKEIYKKINSEYYTKIIKENKVNIRYTFTNK